MTTLILRTVTQHLLPLMLLFSIFALLRGHNDPGGGFIGGLAAAAAFALYAIANSVAEARQLLWLDPRTLIGTGLLIALASGLLSLFGNQAFLTGVWGTPPLERLQDVFVGTPLLFDVGVYVVVLGITLNILFSLAEQ